MPVFIVKISNSDMKSLRKRGLFMLSKDTDEGLIAEIIAETKQEDGFLDPYDIEVIKL